MSQAFVEKPNLESKAFAELPDRERWARFRGAQMNHFTERALPRLFEDQVAKSADKVAVICEHERLTFGELNARANQLARHLRELGVDRESLVGICVDRSLEMAVGILGILKSGGAYLPLDPDYPRERLAFMLNDARPTLVLAKSRLLTQLSQSDYPVRLLDSDWPAIAENSDDNLPETPRANDLAYVIYTSGSTGAPKGVMIEHGNLANYLRALNHELQITGDDLYLHTASIAFSSSRRQLMLPLSQGATVVITTSEQRKDPLALFEMIKNRGVTVMDAVPSFWRSCTAMLEALDEEQRESLLNNHLRLMLSASEPLMSDIPHTWMSRFGHPARHVHMFGQTETAGIVSLYHISPDISGELKVLPIGKPIANSEIYILDKDQQPCPIDVAGELYIGGAGVGRGYLNRPELSAEKFIPHPFEGHDGARLYRTGDWAKYRADGQIEFAGRRDQQVKLRGFRIELGEVETALARHPSISESVVITRANDRAGTSLIAYFVSSGPADTVPKAGELRSFLSDRLPDYAIPSVFVRMAALPLSANGKLNRLALPDPEKVRPNVSNDHVAPRTPVEKRLTAIWGEVLRVESVGVNDNFFELGGHSLLAAQIVARVRAEFKIEIALRVLFESPTVAQMAGHFEAMVSSPDDLLFRTIEPCTRKGNAPLSFTQQQFWLLDQVEPGSSYNVCTAVRITGGLEVQRLQHALATIVERHEILRTNVLMIDGGPVQVIAASMRVPFEVLDLQQLSVSERETEIQNAFAAESEAHFDLSSDPLLRIKLLKVGVNENVLLLTMHHIVCDGWSVGVLLREVATLYGDLLAGRSGSLPQLRIQYADFASWQRRHLQGAWLDRQLEYWKMQLVGAAPTLDLSTDYPRPERQLLRAAQDSILLPAKVSDAIRRLGRQEGATLFMTLLAAFQTLLFRYSGQEDIVVGSPVAGRSMLETEDMIGAFVNTLVLRADFAGNPSFREFLGRVREATLGAFSNQDLPFEKLVEELNPERKTNRTPLFQVMFALQNSPISDVTVEGLMLTPLKLPDAKAKFELTLEAEEEPQGIRLCFEYNAALFAPETIRRMLGHLQNLLDAIVADPTRRVRDLPLLTDSERHQLVNDWSGERMALPEHSCIHTLFEAQVERSPDAIAAEFQGEQVTYRELNNRANQLAHFLRDRGVGPDVLVGICVHRSLEMLVGMLGVLKAGGAYVPLDPAYPAERLAFMIEDAGLSLVLTQARLAGDIPVGRARLFCLDKDWQTIARQDETNPALNVASTNLAYVIYTSGSTGNPKGVMIEHRSLVNFTFTAAEAYEITPADRILQFASLSFDLSVEEIYPALTRGATVVLRTDEMISSARDFLHYCDQWRVTILDLPTAYWHELTDALSAGNLKLSAAVRLVIIGGEKAAFDRVVVWHKFAGKRVRLVNTYGPTETTVAVTMCDLRPQDKSTCLNAVPIGRPLANATVYVLDESLCPVPIGAPGELHIGGPGVARGYVNRPDLTTEKFIQDPFGGDKHARLYKTGDLVRYRSDGNIEFLGRIDNQIKIRGFRVELEEIEQALRSLTGVTDCVVVLREGSDGDKRLIAYVVLDSHNQLTTAELRNHLKTKLPSYMMPALFEMIDALPLLPSGKINRRALPESQATRFEKNDSFVAPRTPIEQLLAVEWCDVLKLERVGIHDNFFELGGHSLLAAKVVSKVRNNLEIELGMVDLFQAPTIASLAALLFPRGAHGESEDDLAAMLGELANLTDEEAQLRFDSEILGNEVAVA
ncbi:MAG TPA: amino acid adenylation domain-containing protein [Pyrinomonadaceae bacterium]|nr:amino acid adenylation domain-containing protein [Pyrinomonadaceae bacterium]